MSLEKLNKDIQIYESVIDMLSNILGKFRHGVKNGDFTQKSFDEFLCKNIDKMHKQKQDHMGYIKMFEKPIYDDMIRDSSNVVKLFGSR